MQTLTRAIKQSTLQTVKPLSKRAKTGPKTNYRLMQVKKYCRMPHLRYFRRSKLLFVVKIFVLSIFEWQFTQILLYLEEINFITKTKKCYHKMGQPIRKCYIIRRSVQPFLKRHSYRSNEVRSKPFLMKLVFASCGGPGQNILYKLKPITRG